MVPKWSYFHIAAFCTNCITLKTIHAVPAIDNNKTLICTKFQVVVRFCMVNRETGNGDSRLIVYTYFQKLYSKSSTFISIHPLDAFSTGWYTTICEHKHDNIKIFLIICQNVRTVSCSPFYLWIGVNNIDFCHKIPLVYLGAIWDY